MVSRCYIHVQFGLATQSKNTVMLGYRAVASMAFYQSKCAYITIQIMVSRCYIHVQFGLAAQLKNTVMLGYTASMAFYRFWVVVRLVI